VTLCFFSGAGAGLAVSGAFVEGCTVDESVCWVDVVVEVEVTAWLLGVSAAGWAVVAGWGVVLTGAVFCPHPGTSDNESIRHRIMYRRFMGETSF
jgi:hypothetical protein